MDALESALAEALLKRQQLTVDDGDGSTRGLAQLVLTLIRLIHDLLEKQAIRRLDAGNLSEEEADRLGRALMQQAEAIERICEQFGLTPADLKLDLGPLLRI
ncbi:MAG: gas vesicle protein K [Xanthomonadales bacterium]|jgi:hypothetical protein|nr:gas vesicle protein K [Xanthomonadales bacterium]